MELWFSELHADSVKLSIRVDKQVVSMQSDYQRIDIFDSEQFGRFLTLDGYMMLTEKDEFIYHEMITHVPMAVHPSIKNILVIGGGDGGAVRELLKYDTVENIDLVEIDGDVIEACKKYMPFTASGLDDKRVNIYVEDGIRYIRNKRDIYDLIIVDSTDPFGPGEGLFTREFYGNCQRALKEDGILVNQHESPFYDNDREACRRMHRHISEGFKISKVFQAHIPTYPSGHWLFGFASKKYHPVRDIKEDEWNKLGIKTKYYTTKLHRGAFYLPKYVEDLLKDVEKE